MDRERLIEISTADPATGCPYCGAPRQVLRAGPRDVPMVTCGAEGCRKRQSADIAAHLAEEAAAKDPDSWKRRGGMPEQFIRARMADFEKDPTPAKRESLLVYGPVGTGKTHLAAAYVDKLGESRFRWIRPGQLSDEAFHGTETPYLTCPLLVLDDLGSTRADSHATGLIYEALAMRDEAMRPTVVTSNLTPEELGAWDPRIWSRIVAYRRINVAGKNRRVKRGAAPAEKPPRKDVDG